MTFSAQKTCSINSDIQLVYREVGAGTPVVLLHGLADHGGVWQSLAESLSDRYRCVAPDLRGHGNSSKPPESEYDSRSLVYDLETLTETLNLEKPDVVAHSWAAKIALLWAQQQPTRIRRLVLVDPFFVNRLSGLFRPTFPLLYRTLPFLKVMGPFANYEAAMAVAQGLKQYRGWSELQATVFREGMEQTASGEWVSKFAIAARNGVFNDVLHLAGLTTTLEVPTCLLLPQQGLNRMSWQTKPYQRYLPNLTVKTIPGNHWPHLVVPDALQKVVTACLAD
jgi:pimeloyl-ACP methyl ester carboxylesterase